MAFGLAVMTWEILQPVAWWSAKIPLFHQKQVGSTHVEMNLWRTTRPSSWSSLPSPLALRVRWHGKGTWTRTRRSTRPPWGTTGLLFTLLQALTGTSQLFLELSLKYFVIKQNKIVRWKNLSHCNCYQNRIIWPCRIIKEVFSSNSFYSQADFRGWPPHLTVSFS